MPRLRHLPGRRRPVPSGHGAGAQAGPGLRAPALRVVAAGVTLAALAALAASPAAASAGRPGRPQVAAVPGITITITSVSPAYATPKGEVTVSGTITNATATTATGLTVELWSSNLRLASEAAMASYLTPAETGVDAPTGSELSVASLAARATQPWSLTLRMNQVGMTSFGVYPLAAQLSQNGTPLYAARTFLPFWPGNTRSHTVSPESIAWVWPLIDTPHQGACPALLNDDLAASLGSGGRLRQLLAVGASPLGRQAAVTWAIDPALLSDAKTMTSRYQVGGTATCSHASPRPASAAAQAWLAGVRSAAAQQDFFITPYADVDVAALSHRGLNTELGNAFADGRAVAAKPAMLGRVQRTGSSAASGQESQPGPAGLGVTGFIAWPPDGVADYSVIQALAAKGIGIGTVILNSTMMPTAPAVTSTPDGVNGDMHVLLADGGIGQILSLPSGTIPGAVSLTGAVPGPAPPSSPAATAFTREQWFLAETAMTASQAGPAGRALVVAPPSRWNPGTGLARALLAESITTPWLRPASLAGLVAAGSPSGKVAAHGLPGYRVSPTELKAPLVRQVKRLDAQIRLLESIFVPPGTRYLSTAVDAVESTAWGVTPGGKRAAAQLVHKISAYVTAQQQQVTIVNPVRVTLGGKSGEVPVSISNRLGQAVAVRLQVAASSPGRVTTGNFNDKIVVASRTQKTVKIPVRAAQAGSTTLTLWLTAPDGRPLPGSAVKLTLEATHFGSLAIVIIGIALAVFVLTAAARALRRGSDEGDEEGETAQAGPTAADPAYAEPEADTVEPEGAGQPDAARQPDAAKEPDEHASTPGWAERR